MKKFVVTRRQILRGVGGYSLGLPFLPSLMPGRAYASNFAFAPIKRFVSFANGHGAIAPESMYPADATLANTFAFKPGHTIKYGSLKGTADGNYNQVSSVLRAPASVLTDTLIGKMNVLRGFDIPFYIGHHQGGHLGNIDANAEGQPKTADGQLKDPLDPTKNLVQPCSTIDQVMAWSSNFYTDLSTNKMRCIVTGDVRFPMSFVWSNAAGKSGPIQEVAGDGSSLSLFGKLFVPATSTVPPPAKRKPIVDLVFSNYQNLRQSNRRLSMADKQRLDAHIAQLAELQRVLNLKTTPPASCGSYTTPTLDSKDFGVYAPMRMESTAVTEFGLINDVVAMAFACGTSRIANIQVANLFSDYAGDWHNDVAHQATDPAKQAMLVAQSQGIFEGAVVDLAAKLDALQDAPGATVLDNTHCQWTQEAGWSTHEAQDMPIVVFGSAGGHFKTGQFVDFRNLSTPLFYDRHCGVLVRQWLAAVLQGMGIPPSEFEAHGKTGYGDPYYNPNYAKSVHPDIIDKASDPLPVITVGV